MEDGIPHRTQWVSEQLAVLGSFAGRNVIAVIVEEMALFGEPEAPVFSHPALPFVQASTIDFHLSEGGMLRVSNWQDDDEFALSVTPLRAPELETSSAGPTLWRRRSLTEAQLGVVEAARWEVDQRGNVQVIRLSIGGMPIILRAGEVYEELDGSVTVRDRDESVLAFFDDQAYRDTVFGVPVLLGN